MTQPQTLPVPFYVLCGSLGAGKTTLLMRLLEFWNSQGHKVGVLMNEAGEVSIDGPRAGTIAGTRSLAPDEETPLVHGTFVQIGHLRGTMADRRYVMPAVPAGVVDPATGLLARAGFEQEIASALAIASSRGVAVPRASSCNWVNSSRPSCAAMTFRASVVYGSVPATIAARSSSCC